MLLTCLRVLAIASVALYLVPTGAHLFELPHKMALTPADYMTVQRIYQGWSLFSIVLLAALVLNLLHAFMRRHSRGVAILSLGSFLCMAATLVVFLVFTLPMNVASSNWTVTPVPFGPARRQWEYSHAVSAVLTFLALSAISAAVAFDVGGRRVQPRSSEPSE